MKTSANLLAISLTMGLIFFSCSEDNEPLTGQDKNRLEEILQAGIWKVTRFEDSGKDETSHFGGYDFVFGSNKSLTAENGVNRMEGSWSIMDQSSDDDSPDAPELVILFSDSGIFEELNEDWDIVSYAQNLVELIHVSGGNGGTDYLTFERD